MNLNLLPTIKASFHKYLTTHPRSNEKLKILHPKIANDLQNILGKDYIVESLGIGKGKERKINGRYINKFVDITISKVSGEIVGGIAVKFVMSNYAQNSNNYFENMLGETANIRCAGFLYFQILIIPDEIPYYDKEGMIKRGEIISIHQVEKYIKLSEDNPQEFLHTPDKTLLMIISLPKLDIIKVRDKKDYKKSYLEADIMPSFVIKDNFKSSLILNDYDTFIAKTAHRIQAA